jgi:spore protease
MLEKFRIRTDLALEEQERFSEDQIEVSGVEVQETYDEEREIAITKVLVTTEKGARRIGKPAGTYVTIEAPNLSVPDEGYHREVSEVVANTICELLKGNTKRRSILVVGIGNRQVTPDALGPYVVDNLKISRHIIREYGRYAMYAKDATSVSAIVPGVMAQTGMETMEILKGIIQETEPELVIAIDALAARNTRRLNRTIQITDTGISPGSGVGNHRNGLNKDSLGVPVIAIGVPTVVDAATIVNDSMENLITAMEQSEILEGVGKVLRSYNATEKYELIQELISPHLNGMFVTPKDIDETVKRISYTVSEALNMLFGLQEES